MTPCACSLFERVGGVCRDCGRRISLREEVAAVCMRRMLARWFEEDRRRLNELLPPPIVRRVMEHAKR